MKCERTITFFPRALTAGMLLLLVACCSRESPQEACCPLPVTAPAETNAVATNTPAQPVAENEAAPTNAPPESDLDIKRISRTVAYSLPVFHLNQLPMDTYISTNAFNLFIGSLDPSHTYFLQSDIETFRQDAPTLHRQLRKGDISFARKVYEVLMERIENRMAFVEKQLQAGFDTDKAETFLWDREDAAWPKDEAEWDELWRKRIKNEYIARLVSGELYDEETDTVTETTSSPAAVEATNTLTATAASTDEALEDPQLTPEEFILERYKQFMLTMDSFDEEMLLQRFLTSFTQVYDPHSDYMSPSSVEDFDINMKLSLVGIGAMLRPEDGTAKIVRIIPGGPAERDGRLKAGDKIIAVGQGDEEPVSILHWPLYKAVRLIRGEEDTKVVLTIIPASDRTGSNTRKIELVREEVKLEEQAAQGEVKTIQLSQGRERRIGIITLPDFYADFHAEQGSADIRRASTDVRELIHAQLTEGIDGLILDLRNNGGGSLVEAIETAGLFITSGPIVQVKERNGIQVLSDPDPMEEYDGPMLVLVNRLSASASEILAAALQDYKRAIIVGDEKTHGKGTVQTLRSLGERKGSLKLTTAGFYRINGGSTQLKGVTPDIIIPSYLDVMGLGEDSLEHTLPWDTEHPAMYRTRKGLTELIPLLVEQSNDRLANNTEFQNFLAKRERLKERYESKTVSLALSNRLAEAAAEKELDEIQSDAFLEEDEDEPDNDLVLGEAVNILSDLIDLQQADQSEELLAPNLSSTDI